MVSGLWGEGKGKGRTEGSGSVSEGSTCLPSPARPISLSPPPPSPPTSCPLPRSLSLQGAILTTMLATRNFSGRWWDLEVPNISCTGLLGALPCRYLWGLRPGPGETEGYRGH